MVKMGIIGEHVFERDEKKAALSAPVFFLVPPPIANPWPPYLVSQWP